MYTIEQTYNYVFNKLKNSCIESPHIDTSVILSKVLDKNKSYIYTYPEKKINKKRFELIKKYSNLRAKNEPLAYILGEKEFYGLKFKVNKNVLIPRQETELIVEEAVKIINQYALSNRPYTISDIGTGSGNIAISIIKELKIKNLKLNMFAVDKSLAVLKIAEQNAILHNVRNKINFVLSDKLEYFIKNRINLDLIISNPPYITKKEYQNLQPEIYFEPKESLLTETGLEFYKYFARYSKYVLSKEGNLVLEINSNLLKPICELFIKNGFKILKIIYDYSSLPRGLVIKLNDY